MIGQNPPARSAAAALGSVPNMPVKSAKPETDDVCYFQHLTRSDSEETRLKTDASRPEDSTEDQASNINISEGFLLQFAHQLFGSFEAQPKQIMAQSPIVAGDPAINLRKERFQQLLNGQAVEQLGAGHLPARGFEQKAAASTVRLSTPLFDQFSARDAATKVVDKSLEPLNVAQKPDDKAANLPAISLSQMATIFGNNDLQTVQIIDLPQVTRVQIDQLKRNSSGVLTSLELVLEPIELGRITANLRHEEGRVVLVLSAEHQHVADDLARDSGLLLRVLGDQIQGVEKMAIFIQTEAPNGPVANSQTFADLRPDQQPRHTHSSDRHTADLDGTEISIDAAPINVNTTQRKITI